MADYIREVYRSPVIILLIGIFGVTTLACMMCIFELNHWFFILGYNIWAMLLIQLSPAMERNRYHKMR